MTPAQHVTAGADLLTAVLARPGGPTHAELGVVRAHGHLGRSAGSGAPYTAAESAITTAAALVTEGRQRESAERAAAEAEARALLA